MSKWTQRGEIQANLDFKRLVGGNPKGGVEAGHDGVDTVRPWVVVDAEDVLNGVDPEQARLPLPRRDVKDRHARR